MISFSPKIEEPPLKTDEHRWSLRTIPHRDRTRSVQIEANTRPVFLSPYLSAVLPLSVSIRGSNVHPGGVTFRARLIMLSMRGVFGTRILLERKAKGPGAPRRCPVEPKDAKWKAIQIVSNLRKPGSTCVIRHPTRSGTLSMCR